jgi:hypothetical protein
MGVPGADREKHYFGDREGQTGVEGLDDIVHSLDGCWYFSIFPSGILFRGIFPTLALVFAFTWWLACYSGGPPGIPGEAGSRTERDVLISKVPNGVVCRNHARQVANSVWFLEVDIDGIPPTRLPD